MIEFKESSRLTMSNTHIKTVRPDFIFSLFRNSPTWSMSTKICLGFLIPKKNDKSRSILPDNLI